MLKVVKPHHYSKKEKFRALSGQTTMNYSWAVLEEHSRSKRYEDLEWLKKRATARLCSKEN